MQEWIEKELATAHFGTVHTRTRARKPRTPSARPRKSKGNVKLRKRFLTVLNTMSQKPSLKFPAGCNGPAEVKAAYRFLDNEHVTFTTILGPHQQATLERIRDQPVVLIPQDTTELDLSRPNEVMTGSGPLNDTARVGFFDHISLAVTPQHLALGVVDAEVWRGLPSESRRMPRRSAPSGAPSPSRRRRAFAGSRAIVRPAGWREPPRGRSSSRSPIAKAMSTSISWKRSRPGDGCPQGLVHHSRRSGSRHGRLRRGPVLGPDTTSSRARRRHARRR